MGRASDSRPEQLTGSSGIRMEWRITESPRVFAVLMAVWSPLWPARDVKLRGVVRARAVGRRRSAFGILGPAKHR